MGTKASLYIKLKKKLFMNTYLWLFKKKQINQIVYLDIIGEYKYLLGYCSLGVLNLQKKKKLKKKAFRRMRCQFFF